MITPEEISKKANRKYISYLQSKKNGDVFFPLIIPGNKIPSKSTSNYSNEIKNLYLDSKEKKGYGYEIIYTKKRKKGLGLQSLPTQFIFKDEIDYLKYLGKENEVSLFNKLCDRTFAIFPELKDVIFNKPSILLNNFDKWEDLLKVCTYFKNNPNPKLYIRELPIKVHTKFVEKNQSVLTTLLDAILDPNDTSLNKSFEKRFGLKYAEPMIRFKILDHKISNTLFSGIDDMALPLSLFQKLNLKVSRIVILENKVSLYNALTIPDKDSTIAIFGQGYSVSNLKEIEWFNNAQIIYWGDFDAHGFDILSQIRGYYENVQSILMDKDTFNKFYESEKGKILPKEDLPNLLPEEQELYKLLKLNNWRLEQEKIPRDHFINAFNKI